MRLLFLILAHDRPAQTIELARRLVETAQDGIAMIHYDAASPAAEFAELEAAATPRIRLVRARARGAWGSFGLVEAPLNAFAEIEAEDLAPDYVVLISGACLPCRPIAQLERYLVENAGREFIEAEDERWVSGGWRSERWRYRFWFDHRRQRPLEWAFFHAQRLLGIERRFPEGLVPHFGSQWWALTWSTARAILADTRRDPKRLAFFRSVWIPDEMVFQTWVRALVHPDEIAGFGLTHFQFTNRGKPVVYHDDHAGYIDTLERFFVRKVSPAAARLRARLLERAGAPDDGADLGRIGTRRRDYAVKVAAQAHYPVPGQIFYRDQLCDMIDPVLARAETPYIVVVGPPRLARSVIARLPAPPFERLGAVFAPGEVGLGREADGTPRQVFHGLARGDVPLRDLHPALYLARLRARARGVPVIAWSPFDAPKLLAAVLRDPRALVLACLPYTGVEARDRQLLALAARGDLARLVRGPSAETLGIAPEQLARARADELGLRTGWLDWLGKDLFYHMDDGSHLLRNASISLPWNPQRSRLNAAQRRRFFEESLAACRFASFHWFPALRRALGTAWEEELGPAAAALLGQLSPDAASVLEDILGEPPAGRGREAGEAAQDPAHDPGPATVPEGGPGAAGAPRESSVLLPPGTPPQDAAGGAAADRETVA